MWGNVEYSGEQNITEIFDQYFCSVAVVMEQNLGHCTKNPLYYLFNRTTSSIFPAPVTPGECFNFIKQLKNTKQTKKNVPLIF